MNPPSMVQQGCWLVIPNPRCVPVRDLLHCFLSSAGARATMPLRYILIATHVDTGFEALANSSFSRHQLR
jgi:hypothetical protein